PAVETTGELRPEAQVARAQCLLLWDVEIARLLQERAAPGADLREGDPGGDRDVEALRETGHRDAEGAAARLQRLARRPFVLVPEEERERATCGQVRRRARASLEVPGEDRESPGGQAACGGGSGIVRDHVDPLVRVL